MNNMAHAVLRLLEKNKIDYTLAEHPAVFNMEELYAQGLEHCDAIAKNLLVRDQKKRFYWLLVLYGEKRADLKALKARLGHGALSFAGAEELAELLSLTPGSVTPFGALNDKEHRVTILLDEDYRGKLILQEFIPGGDDAMRVLNSYSDLDGHVRAMCLGQPVLEYYDPKSVGNYAAIISRGDQSLYDKMQEFLEKLAGLNMMKLLTNDVVYGKREDCVYNHTVALWQNVPTGILRRYVKDQELSDELKQFKGTHTLFCKGDLPLSRLYRLLRYYAAQYHNFRDYYFDKK